MSRKTIYAQMKTCTWTNPILNKRGTQAHKHTSCVSFISVIIININFVNVVFCLYDLMDYPMLFLSHQYTIYYLCKYIFYAISLPFIH